MTSNFSGVRGFWEVRIFLTKSEASANFRMRKNFGFAHFLALFVKSAETPLFAHFDVFVVWALRLESKYTGLGPLPATCVLEHCLLGTKNVEKSRENKVFPNHFAKRSFLSLFFLRAFRTFKRKPNANASVLGTLKFSEKIRQKSLLENRAFSGLIGASSRPIGAFSGRIGTDSSAPHRHGGKAEIAQKGAFLADWCLLGQAPVCLSILSTHYAP